MSPHTNNKKNKGKKKLSSQTPPVITDTTNTVLNLPIDKDTFQKIPAYQTITENYNKPKVFVCTPCYCGQVHVKYMESMMMLQHILLQNKINFELYTIPFDSLIPRARNACVTRFMESKESTHLLFIDADIQFDGRSVLKMIQENKDIIVGAYPKKALDMEAVKNNYSKVDNQIELIQSSVKYAYNFKPQKTHRVERGVVEVLDGPTGFMLIKKEAIRSMIKTYPHTEYINDVKAYQINPHDRFYDLFQSQVFDGRYLSEDYGFCRLWQRMGGCIFTDLTVKLNHIGQFCYFGDPLTHLKYSQNVSISQNNTDETINHPVLPPGLPEIKIPELPPMESTEELPPTESTEELPPTESTEEHSKEDSEEFNDPSETS